MKAARNFLIIALIALGFWALPGGNSTLNVILALLSIAFFAAIAFLGYRLYREHRFTIDSLQPIQRAVLYGSIGLAILTFAASSRLLNGGAGILVWIALLGIASYGVFWVFQRYRSYD
jgi:O-antigen/teichoic acid export membrane protein